MKKRSERSERSERSKVGKVGKIGKLLNRGGDRPLKPLRRKRKIIVCFCTCCVFVHVMFLYKLSLCICHVFVHASSLYKLCFCTRYIFCTLHVFVQVGQPKKFFTKFSSNFVPAVNHHGSNLFKTLDFSSNHRFQNCHQQIL